MNSLLHRWEFDIIFYIIVCSVTNGTRSKTFRLGPLKIKPTITRYPKTVNLLCLQRTVTDEASAAIVVARETIRQGIKQPFQRDLFYAHHYAFTSTANATINRPLNRIHPRRRDSHGYRRSIPSRHRKPTNLSEDRTTHPRRNARRERISLN